MKQYARIEGSVVMETFNTDLDITTLFNESLIWVEVPEDITPLELPYTFENGMFTKTEYAHPVFTPKQIEENRLSAYADSITGSDRYFIEMLSLQAEGLAPDSPEVLAARDKGLARRREIQNLFPLL